jgi:hypothetical protein
LPDWCSTIWGPSKGSNFASNILVDTTSWGLKTLLSTQVANGTTANPVIAAGGAYAVMPEMTRTFTCRGGTLLILFSGMFNNNGLAANNFFRIFLDGVGIGIEYLIDRAADDFNYTFALPLLDTPSAGSHTYDVRWKCNANPLQALGVARMLQIIELA